MKTLWPPLASVLQLFSLLFSDRWVRQWQRQSKSGFYERVFTLRVTLWYVIFQRLTFDTTLAGVVTDARGGGADGLGKRGRRLSSRIRSANTSSYNEARQRLPLALLQAALKTLRCKIQALVGWRLKGKSPPPPRQRPRQLLDGSTLSMLSTPALAEAFAPAKVRSRVSDWCLMRIVVGFCARSGAVIDAEQGPTSESEQRLAWRILAQAAQWMIWIGDRNFGVWSVVAQAVRFKQDVVVRLTGARARKLMAGKPLASGEDRAVEWSPSRRDQCDEGTERGAIAGRLIYVRLKRGGCGIDLFLFTTLPAADCPLELLVQWYGQRWQAELHFRSVKTQMHLAELKVKSPEMARKEFYAALIAYSLVRAGMWAAGANLEEGPQTLSFNNVRRVVLDSLKAWGRTLSGRKHATRWVQKLLAEVQLRRLPARKTPLVNQPRVVRCRAKPWPILKGSRQAALEREVTSPKSL